jgi:ElaB/YqjD/DUF883 family membrane-anchored ribosome-binding protein
MNTDDTKRDWKSSFAELEQLADEVRVKLHLAGMDAKDAFHEITKKAAHISQNVEQATESAVRDLIARLRRLSEQIVAPDDKRNEAE